MKRILLVASLFAVSAFAAKWTAVVSEEHCGLKHSAGTAGDQKCVTGCVKGKGAKPVLVVDGKIYKIADGSKVADHLGQKVTVEGTLDGDTVTITSVEAAK